MLASYPSEDSYRIIEPLAMFESFTPLDDSSTRSRRGSIAQQEVVAVSPEVSKCIKCLAMSYPLLYRHWVEISVAQSPVGPVSLHVDVWYRLQAKISRRLQGLYGPKRWRTWHVFLAWKPSMAVRWICRWHRASAGVWRRKDSHTKHDAGRMGCRRTITVASVRWQRQTSAVC